MLVSDSTPTATSAVRLCLMSVFFISVVPFIGIASFVWRVQAARRTEQLVARITTHYAVLGFGRL
jgi:hypothetical protein